MNELDKSINNKFEQELIDNGYRFFSDNFGQSIRLVQKRITDERGTKYFITGKHYNFGKQFPQREDLKEEPDRYSFSVQFNLDKSGKYQTVDISFSADFLPNEWRPVTTRKEMEKFFEKAFIKFKFDYYELNFVEEES